MKLLSVLSFTLLFSPFAAYSQEIVSSNIIFSVKDSSELKFL